MTFRPKPQQEIIIQTTTYTFCEHPVASGMAYGQTGTVYQLADGKGELWALKVFLRQYREPRLVGQAERIRPYAVQSGLRACERQVLTSRSHLNLIREFPDLAYAVMMPWITGSTWLERVLGQEQLTPEAALHSARSLADVLAGMEESGLTHCDLSGPNLIMSAEGGIELIDLEEMYGPELMKPEQLPGGSPGYAHKTAPEGLWNTRADRFAGAVLLGEMLGWCDRRVVAAKWGEGYFEPSEMQTNCERYRTLGTVLDERWGSRITSLLDAAWYSDELAACPTFTEWLAALPQQVPAVESEARTGTQVNAGALAFQAEKLVRTGETKKALQILERAQSHAGADLQQEIRMRIHELQEIPAGEIDVSSAQTSDIGAEWVCEVCGNKNQAAQTTCIYCEQSTITEDGPITAHLAPAGQKQQADEEFGGAGHSSRKRMDEEKKGPDEKRDSGGRRHLLLPLGNGIAGIAVIGIVGWLIFLGAGGIRRMSGLIPSVPTGTELTTMVQVPAGTFLMGSTSADSEAFKDEFPQHEVYLDGYWIDKTEVTNEMYAVFLSDVGNLRDHGPTWLDDFFGYIEQENGTWQPGSGYADYPVVEVTWYGAAAYCEWAGRRLPTEAEWEKAARGTDGRIYPWGNPELTCDLAQYIGRKGGMVPVGSYPSGVSPYGVLDMAGNVWEWVADWYDWDYYASPDSNPTGPAKGDSRVLRGGSWIDNPSYLRSATRLRGAPDGSRNYYGFRCARSQ